MPIKYSVCVLSGGAEVLVVGPVLQTSSGPSGLAANPVGGVLEED